MSLKFTIMMMTICLFSACEWMKRDHTKAPEASPPPQADSEETKLPKASPSPSPLPDATPILSSQVNPEETKPPAASPLSVGFVNPGNQCFANAALKFFLSLPRDPRLFDFLDFRDTPLRLALANLVEKVEAKDSNVEDLIHQILTQVSILDSFDDGEQHDSVDFLQSIFDNLNPDFSLFQSYQRLESSEAGKEFVRNVPAEGVKIYPLDIPNPEATETLTLQQVVNPLFVPELMTGDNQVECDSGKCDAKRTMFWRLNNDETTAPDFILLQLKRRITSDGLSYTKVKRQVSIDQGLVLAFEETTQITYHVKAAIVHFGNADGGHYVTYMKEGDHWILHNDSQVTVVADDKAKADIEAGAVSFYLSNQTLSP